jgi:hypothetical protein
LTIPSAEIPFPDALRTLIREDLTVLSIARASVDGKVLGYFAGAGLNNIRINVDRLTYTEQPDADLAERADAALGGGQADQASTEERE